MIRSDEEWFELALARYFEGDLDRIESARFNTFVERSPELRARFDDAWEARIASHGVETLLPSLSELDDCFSVETLQAYVDGDLNDDDRETVESHLGCLLCREQVDALQQEGAQAPAAVTALRPTSRIPASGVVGLLAASVAFAMIVVDWRAEPEPTWTARGSDGQGNVAWDATFWVGTRALSSGDAISPRARVRVRIEAGALDQYFMLAFAVDGAGRVYWYYPAWQDPANDPLAVPLDRRAANGGLVNEAVEHELHPGPLRISVVVSRRRLSVRTVEKMIASRPTSVVTSTRSAWEITSDSLERSVLVHVH